MPPKETNRIETIQQGRIDFYIPLKFETSHNFREICNKINDTLNETFNDHLNKMHSEVQDAYASVQDKIYTEYHGKLSLSRSIKRIIRDRRKSKKAPTARVNDGTSLEISPAEQGVKITINPGEMQSYNDRCEELNHEYEQHKKIYGVGFVNAQRRFVLWPLHVQLINGAHVWISAVIYVFENMMATLKLELPLVNVTVQPLKDYNYDAYLKSVDDKWGLFSDDSKPTIKKLRNAYIQTIANKTHLTIVAQEGMLRNIILARFDGMPNQIHNIPIETQENLYKIISAPVSENGHTSYRQIAREYIAKQSWGYHDMKYILSTTGGCLSIADTTLVDWLHTHYKKEWKVDALGNNDVSLIDRSIIRDLCINAEFALIIPLLKFMNSTYVYCMKRMKPQDMHDIQKKYNLNLMFISRLQEFCYGSASEQAEVFERLMPYYLKKKITEEKMQSIDRILSDEKNQRYEKLQNFLSVIGLIMALVFGLPAINDTFKIIREICTFIPYDVPILTIANTSIVVWSLLILALIIKIVHSQRISKKRTMSF